MNQANQTGITLSEKSKTKLAIKSFKEFKRSNRVTYSDLRDSMIKKIVDCDTPKYDVSVHITKNGI